MRLTSSFGWILCLLALPGCACDEVTDNPDATTPRADARPVGEPCTRAQDCQSGLICDPAADECSAPFACTANEACGVGAICQPSGTSGTSGTCAPNGAGGPCQATRDCIAAESCQGSVCAPQATDGGARCERADDCGPGAVCEVSSGECVTDRGCSVPADCGPGARCVSSSCEPNVIGGPCGNEDECLRGETCLGGECVAGCGAELYTAERVIPNLMIVIDRSGSMNDLIGDTSKWNIARTTTYTLLDDYQNEIYFGLSLFPGFNRSCSEGERCGPGAVNVAIGPSKEVEIEDFLSGAGTCSFQTPIAEELELLTGIAGLQDPARPNYVLLLTDGIATCEDPVPQVTALRELPRDVKTFVVGFGDEVDPDQLAAMARAGGTARSSTPVYYQADNAAALEAAFADIAGSVLSCDYGLSEVPPDPDLLFVYFDGVAVARGSQGWDYSAGAGDRIVFAGTACQQLQSGQVSQLSVVYGCPLPPPLDGGVSDSAVSDSAVSDSAVSDTGVRDGSGGPGDPGGPGDGCQACGDCRSSLACVVPGGESSGVCGACSATAACCAGRVCRDGACVPNL